MKVGSVVYDTRGFCAVSETWPTCSVIKHACACGQENHSSFCHFNPFAFLHLICDGALTCSSISLQWKQYHRIQDVGRLGVTSNVHGNDLKTHLLFGQIMLHGSAGWSFLVLFSTFKTSRFLLSVYFAGLVLGNSTEAPRTQLCG